jgi:hypothetical protein
VESCEQVCRWRQLLKPVYWLFEQERWERKEDDCNLSVVPLCMWMGGDEGWDNGEGRESGKKRERERVCEKGGVTEGEEKEEEANADGKRDKG